MESKQQQSYRPTVTIKLKPYLVEYLQCKLNEPLKASKKNIIGALLFPLLEPRPREVKPDLLSEQADNHIKIQLYNYNNLYVQSGNIYVSDENQKVFQSMLEAHFDDILFSFLDDKYVRTGKIKFWIYEFCSIYAIKFNNINYETLKKKYYRIREKRNNIKENIKKSNNKLSLVCPSILSIII